MSELAERRAETARRNGALSRGPVTEAGKTRSARNAVRHGLSARSLPEPAAGGALAALRGALLARWQPWDAAEAHLVEELLFAHWRQARLRALEEMVLARLRSGEPLDGLPSLATVLRYRARIDRALARTTQELQTLQASRDRIVDPARLRWLADEIERLQAAGAVGTNEPMGSSGDANFTNEFPHGTNEPCLMRLWQKGRHPPPAGGGCAGSEIGTNPGCEPVRSA